MGYGKSLLGAVAGVLSLGMVTANAAIVTINGDDVSFTYDNATLYGTANVIGNTIFFFPTAFRAESTNGSPSIDSISETLSIEVNAITEGFSLSTLMISEDGDYRVDGAGSSVTANGLFRATSLTTLCSGFSPCQDEAFLNAGALLQTGTSNDPWSMGGTINMNNTPGWGSDTSLNLTIENNLSATTLASGEIAWIEKKFSVTIPGVPVPAAVWLFGSGLLGLVGIARRKAA